MHSFLWPLSLNFIEWKCSSGLQVPWGSKESERQILKYFSVVMSRSCYRSIKYGTKHGNIDYVPYL